MGQPEELMQIFLDESRELIESLDQNIVAIESDPHNKPLLDDIFRAFHTLKGNAGLVGLKKFEKIAHITEEILSDIREGRVEISSELITFILEALDRLKILHDAVEKNNSDDVEIEMGHLPQTINEEGTNNQQASSAPENIPVEDSGENAELIADDGSWGLFPENIDHAATDENGNPDDTGNNFDTQSDQAVEVHDKDEGNPISQKADVPKSWNKAESAVRVDVGLLDSLMNLVGELVLSRNQILQFVSKFENSKFASTCQRLNLVTSELQESIMKTRMQPIGNVFNRFRRVVRDVAKDTGKLVNLKIEGQETELDKTIIEGIRDPLTHLVRNAIDHGIEDEKKRKSQGKTPAGTLILRAYHEGGQVNIEIVDDGAGMDVQRIKNKAIEKQLITPEQAQNLADKDALGLIFQPGFSTADKVTNISGRGVGMDVVRNNIEKIGGSVELSSVHGQGSTIKIKIPLTLAIIPALVLKCNDQRFAIPQVSLLELVLLEGENINRIEKVGSAEIYRLRGKLLPIIRLSKMLKLPAREYSTDDAVSIVVLSADNTEFGLIVDDILDTEEIVVKPLSKHLKDIHAFAGATVMGDGKVALILDVVGLAGCATLQLEKSTLDQVAETSHANNHSGAMQSLLLFTLAPDEYFAIPLSLIARLETFPANAVEQTAGLPVIQYRGNIMPLIPLDKELPVTPMPEEEFISVLTFKVDNNDVGLIVNEIIDVMDTRAKLDSEAVKHAGVLGSVVLNGKVTLVIDAFEIIKKNFPHWFDRNGSPRDLNPNNRRVLVVDDSTFIRSTYRTYLEPEGFTIIEAEDGEEALEIISADSFDYIITDIEMPRMDGLELTRNIRANKKLSELPIIVSSSLASDEDLQRGKEAGADAYLKKIDRTSLLSALEAANSEPETEESNAEK